MFLSVVIPLVFKASSNLFSLSLASTFIQFAEKSSAFGMCPPLASSYNIHPLYESLKRVSTAIQELSFKFSCTSFVLKDLIEVFVSLLLFPEQAIKVTVVDTAIKPKVNFFNKLIFSSLVLLIFY